MSKICIICKEDYPLEDYYKHNKMEDGHLNKCKTCCKRQAKERETYLRANDPEWIEKDRERCREKFHRLSKNWKKITSEMKKKYINTYTQNFPEKYQAKKVTSKIIKNKGFELHHWSYNEEHYKDCIELDIKTHNLIHRFLIYDQEYYLYRTIQNELLDTRDKHLNYINNVIQKNN